MSQNTRTPENTRSSPRAVASLEVDVTISGQPQRVLLVSQDIGAGGMFLRTTEPAAKWSRVELTINRPDASSLTVGGEVVRSVPVEEARAKRQAPGMAVAFDEVSRPKRKELIELVLDLCARRPSAEERRAQAEAETPPPPREEETAGPSAAPAEQSGGETDAFTVSGTDALLDQMDDILDEVEASQSDLPPVPATAASSDQVDDDPLDLASDSLELDLPETPEVEAPPPAMEEKTPAPPPVAPAATKQEEAVPAPEETSSASGSPPQADAVPAAADSAPEAAAPAAEPQQELGPAATKAPATPPAGPDLDEKVQALKTFLERYRKALKGDTHYDVLLIKRDASHEKISIAYKKLLRALKPPAPPEVLGEDLVRQLASVLGKIRKAFAILAKPDRKKAYDFLIDNDGE